MEYSYSIGGVDCLSHAAVRVTTCVCLTSTFMGWRCREQARSLLVLLPLSAIRKLTKPNDVSLGYSCDATVVNLPELCIGIELTWEF